MPKSSVFCHRWNNHSHIFKNIGMAKVSEPARRMGWGENNGSYTRSRWRRKRRGKNCTGIYSAKNKVSTRTRRTLRYCYERLLFSTFFSQNVNRVHPCNGSLRWRGGLRKSESSWPLCLVIISVIEKFSFLINCKLFKVSSLCLVSENDPSESYFSPCFLKLSWTPEANYWRIVSVW